MSTFKDFFTAKRPRRKRGLFPNGRDGLGEPLDTPAELATYDGTSLRAMLATATAHLERNAQAINILNVFPVPDGDTGTNMLLTMRSTLEELARQGARDTPEVAKAMAHGALMGARGNSGVILSQILRGLAQVLGKTEFFTGRDLALALKEAAVTAYRGVSRPVEGTMLTVIREAAEAATQADGDLVGVMEATVDAARESVARTPSLLAVLREAGVVDAGGQGLYVMFEGMLSCLRGQAEELPYGAELAPPAASPRPTVGPPAAPTWGYCTECLIQGEKLDPEAARQKMESLGDSVIVVGDESTLRVHVHAFDPGAVLSYAVTQGTLIQVKVQNMDEQHEEWLTMQPPAAAPFDRLRAPPRPPRPAAPPAPRAVVAVSPGPGWDQVFTDLGAAALIAGGQTMNPSTEDILRAIDSAPAPEVLILPNNKNIVLAATQARAVSPKKVAVIPSHSVPQGVAALLAFNPEVSLEDNAHSMAAALGNIRSGAITAAIRTTQVGGVEVKQGQLIGIAEEELAVAGDDMAQVLTQLLHKLGAEDAELVTLYYGAEVTLEEAEATTKALQEAFPQAGFEVVAGGQPHYPYLVSVE